MIMASLKFIHQSLFTLYVRCVESITLTSCSFACDLPEPMIQMVP